MREKQDAQDAIREGTHLRILVKTREELFTLHSAQLILVTLKAPLAVEYYTLHVLDDYKRRKVLARDLLAFLLPAFLCLLSLWLVVVAPESLLSLPQLALRCAEL